MTQTRHLRLVSPTESATALLESPTDTDAFSLTIDKVVYGGEGLGRRDTGEVFFVPWSAPGDTVQVVREPGSAKPAKARIEELIIASPDRVASQCEVFGTCGGCQWQHLSPSAQRLWKRNIVQESLQRIGGLKDVTVSDTLCDDAAGADTGVWRFRNRVQWEIEPEGEGWGANASHALGYYQAQSHEVVSFSDCRIMPEDLNPLAHHLQTLLREGGNLASGLLRVEAFVNPKGDTLLSLHGARHPGLKLLAENLMETFPELAGVVHFDTTHKFPRGHVLQGVGHLMLPLGGKRFRVSAGSFFQTNHQVAEQMVALLQQWLPDGTDSLLDLYAGVGTFAVCLHEKVRRIMAIESAPVAMADAQENLRLNGVKNIELKTGDARRILQTLNARFEAAIVDPPRAGCQPEVLKWINQFIQKRLLYVSCNPTTLARDLKTLTAQGWQIQAVQPLDMFPQTYHVETLVHLTRD